MTQHRIVDVVGEYAITLEDGDQVYRLIHDDLMHGRIVELDFAGVSVYASPFLNAAIGRLLEDMSLEDLRRQLKLTNMTSAGTETLRRVVENSRNFYQRADYRDAVSQVIRERASAS